MLKNVTLSADETLIDQARLQATLSNQTLNELFREWLAQYVAQPEIADQYEQLMEKLNHVQSGQQFDRETLNER